MPSAFLNLDHFEECLGMGETNDFLFYLDPCSILVNIMIGCV